ncbi:heat-inducible transcriptional repressor HrcA [Parvularcula oceani]|uniref:heat-inducible transcriptional repressor HrcA n=1 Tax=Parvularcula oceani TaxID=1247963 RepID=UPI0004E1DAF3|nr:heat-inducible transcriptional repressor HrcA [Parvularcula oceani]
MTLLTDIDARSRALFKRLVETYLETGEPVGSRTLSRGPGIDVSPATIRNVMADLTELGLLGAPHASAGRIPTERGLRLFIDGMMEIGAPSPEERRALEADAGEEGAADLLDRAARSLSGLTQTASLVVASKSDRPLRHVEFVRLDPDRALAVLVDERGDVENRLIALPQGLPASALERASNFLNAQLSGKTLTQSKRMLLDELEAQRGQLDDLTADLVRRGVAEMGNLPGGASQLIVRGQANLLEGAGQDLERVQQLFEELERKQGLIDLLEAAKDGEGVRVFIGSENRLFSLSGSSIVAAPYRDSERNIVGVVGVVGPTRLNYARVVPLVDYTAEVVTRLIR